MKEGFFPYGKFRLHYHSYGEGNEIILAFHGFGRKSADFEVFLPLLKPHQRLISMHLFAHGESEFPDERIERYPLTTAEWKEILEAFFASEGVDSFHLLAYSMGGRIAMTTSLLFRQRVKSLLLIAPDGFKINLIYRFAVGTLAGRRIYKMLIDRPEILFRTADFLHKLGILNAKLHRFVYVHMDSKEKRWQVHDAWLIYREFFPDLDGLALEVRNHTFRFQMIFGLHDSVIRPALGKKFCKKIGGEEPLHLLPSGHKLLTEATADYIRVKGLWP